MEGCRARHPNLAVFLEDATFTFHRLLVVPVRLHDLSALVLLHVQAPEPGAAPPALPGRMAVLVADGQLVPPAVRAALCLPFLQAPLTEVAFHQLDRFLGGDEFLIAADHSLLPRGDVLLHLLER